MKILKGRVSEDNYQKVSELKKKENMVNGEIMDDALTLYFSLAQNPARFVGIKAKEEINLANARSYDAYNFMKNMKLYEADEKMMRGGALMCRLLSR